MKVASALTTFGLLGALLLGALGCDGDAATGTGGAGASASSESGSGTSMGIATGSASSASGSGGTAGAGGPIGPGAAACVQEAPPADPVCEATGAARCFYIDPNGGDDANSGSYESPWRTFANAVSYYGTPGENGSTAAPPGAIALGPGDYLYLEVGNYSDLYNYDGSQEVALFRGVNGSADAPIHLKAYPGQTPVIDPGGATVGLDLLQSAHWEITGIEIANAYGNGLRLEEDDDVVVSHVTIHDTDGIDNDNVSGLYLVSSTSIDVGCSLFHDNFDHENADTGGDATENSTNMVAFAGGNLHVHHSSFYQTPGARAEKTGGCLKYKHAETLAEGVFEVDHNELHGCRFFAIGTGTQHSHVHHNVITDGAGISSRDFGGPTHQIDQRFEFNTLFHAGGLDLSPTDDWNDATFDSPQAIVFANNVVFEDRADESQENGTVVIGTYASDALFQETAPEISFSLNCYFNAAGPLHFDLFAANGGNYGVLGDQYDFASWRALPYDADSLEGDPLFVDAGGGDFTLQPSSTCQAMGAYATP